MMKAMQATTKAIIQEKQKRTKSERLQRYVTEELVKQERAQGGCLGTKSR